MNDLLIEFFLAAGGIILIVGILRVIFTRYTSFGTMLIEVFWFDILWVIVEFLFEAVLWVIVLLARII